MNAFLQWLDDRTKICTASENASTRPLPGGASWTRVWPCTIVFTFAVQVITGLVLWMYYSPSAQTAWESVYYIQHEVWGGWLLRAVHHYSGQVLLVLIGIYVIQLVLTRKCRAPREFVFWTAVFMGLCALGLLLTGDLLEWDQNSVSATQTRVGFLNGLPLIGHDLFKLAAGGPAFGSLTLTRFVAYHIGLFAGGFLVLCVAMIYFQRKADESEREEGKTGTPLFPDQVLRSAIACCIVIGVVFILGCMHGVTGDHRGVGLGTPADMAESYAAARPEWAFMGLYGFAEWFPAGESRVLKLFPIFIIPGCIVVLLLLIPLICRWFVGYLVGSAVIVVLLAANFFFALHIVNRDVADEKHQLALQEGRQRADRALELVRGPMGIPPTGALTLLRNDPKTVGPELFKQHCASCHDHTAPDGSGIKAEETSAPNLFAYGTRKWVAGWLDSEQIAGPDYFGNTAFRNGDMVGFVRDVMTDLDDEEVEEVEAIVAALSAQAGLKSQAALDLREIDKIELGQEMITDVYGCTDCHKFGEKGQLGMAPDLTGYASREWTIGIIANPEAARFYPDTNDRMPAYAENEDDPSKNLLSAKQIELLTDWLRGEWYEPEMPESREAPKTEEPNEEAEPEGVE